MCFSLTADTKEMFIPRCVLSQTTLSCIILNRQFEEEKYNMQEKIKAKYIIKNSNIEANCKYRYYTGTANVQRL
jgi:hypothetical protein